MNADLDHFYEILQRLEDQLGQGSRLGDMTGRAAWPARGVYFFREPGEWRHRQSRMPRIVRVGTHAVSAGSKSTLWGRLRTHRGRGSGSGSHRSSVFRLHVGAAMLARDAAQLPSWGVGSSAAKEIRLQEADHERRVSEYLATMTVLWIDVPDDPGPRSHRVLIERNAIALLSNDLNPQDPPSAGWLGRASPRDEIRGSGLWNLNHVRSVYDPRFLDVLEGYVVRTGRA